MAARHAVMANGRRCETGCETWPDQNIFSTCPICNGATTRYRDMDPLDVDEAMKILADAKNERAARFESDRKRRKFEVYYADRCARIGVPVEGPLSDDDLARISDHAKALK